MGVHQDPPGPVAEVKLVTIRIRAPVLPASTAILSLPVFNFDAIETARRLRNRAGQDSRRLGLSAHMHKSHGDATDVDPRGVADELVFPELTESSIEDQQSSADPKKQSASRI